LVYLDPSPPPDDVAVDVGSSDGSIANGTIAAEVSVAGAIRFVRTRDGGELLAEEDRHFAGPPARFHDETPGGATRIEACPRVRIRERGSDPRPVGRTRMDPERRAFRQGCWRRGRGTMHRRPCRALR
jgi:hypothetical protein